MIIKKRDKSIASFIVIFFALTLSFYSYADTNSQATWKADDYLRQGQYLEAIGAYQDIIDQTAPIQDQAKATLRIGDIYSYFLNNYDKALEQYAFIRKHFSATAYAANAYFNSGMILYEKGDYGEALALFRDFLQHYPENPRRQTAEFMVDACLNPPPAAMESKEAPAMPAPDTPIRILIQEKITKATVYSTASLTIRPSHTQTDVQRFQANQLINITADSRGFVLNGKSLPYDRIEIESFSGILTVNNSQYRGNFRLQKRNGNSMDVVNIVGLEEYLYGVIPKEISHLWPEEMLKAQAVAARTYALYQKDKNSDKDYDVYATTASQVYGGYKVEKEATNKAVNATKGKVLIHKNELVLAYFHSNSGGRTEDAQNVWTADVPYLKSIQDPYSEKAPSYQWEKFFSIAEIQKALNRRGLDIGRIQALQPLKVSPAGRVIKLRIVHSKGETVISGNNFRINIDPVSMKSTLFSTQKEKDGFLFKGKGYGHGVGMSQWGGYIMAKTGHSYQEILNHYYTNTEIR